MRFALPSSHAAKTKYHITDGDAFWVKHAIIMMQSLHLFAAFISPALVNFLVFLRPQVAHLRYEFKVQWKRIVLNAAVIDLGYFFLLKAFQIGNVTQIISISATSTLLTALAGIVLLKERKHIAIKIVASVLATLGVLLVQH